MIRADVQPALPRFRCLNGASVARCPHLILAAAHHRDNGTCRCDDPTHSMGEDGYRWDARQRRWLSPDGMGSAAGRRRRWWWRRRR